MKEFADLKEILSEKVEDLQNKINEIQKELEIYKKVLAKIDSILEKETFKTAAEIFQEENKEEEEEAEIPTTSEPLINKEFEIKTEENTPIGKMLVEGGIISIIPAENITISENDAPFKTFFLGRILKQLEEEDQKEIRSGELSKDQKISYEIIKSEDNIIQNILIKNYRTNNRMMKIFNTISWTFKTILKPK